MALVLIDLAPRTTVATVSPIAPGELCVCDSYIVGAEGWPQVPGGWAHDRFVNVDHHAPVARMARRVSSANLAIERVMARGTSSGTVVITHTDCDSILSAGLMTGRLMPHLEYGAAAIAADHTGAADPIADLLQALDAMRDVEYSFDCLARLEQGHLLPDIARGRLDDRRRRRDAAAEVVRAGRVQVDGGLALGTLDAAIDGEFFPTVLPDAAVIVLFSPWPDDPERWEVKVRLGQAAPEGMTLDALGWESIDPVQLGRWNARSNKRGGGTLVQPDAYAAAVRRLWSRHLSRTTEAP